MTLCSVTRSRRSLARCSFVPKISACESISDACAAENAFHGMISDAENVASSALYTGSSPSFLSATVVLSNVARSLVLPASVL
eukprot:365878-Chlamydomonas_euryale.AAC.5